MIDQTITTPPQAPSSNDIPNFKARFDAFLAWMVVFVSQLVTLVSQINSTATTVNNDATTASNAKDAAVVSANFQGTWTNQTTQIGQSWEFEGIVYRVLIAGNTSPTSSPLNWASIATASDALLSLINQKADTTDVDTALGNKADKATSLSGYGITNAYTKTETDAFFNKPSFSAYRATSTQALSAATNTKVQFNGEEFDTNNAFDSTTNFRFTPQSAGKYSVVANIALSSNANILLTVYKNGAPYKTIGTITNVLMTNCNGSCIIDMNGTTDYIEIYAYSSVVNTVLNNQAQTFFQASKI